MVTDYIIIILLLLLEVLVLLIAKLASVLLTYLLSFFLLLLVTILMLILMELRLVICSGHRAGTDNPSCRWHLHLLLMFMLVSYELMLMPLVLL